MQHARDLLRGRTYSTLHSSAFRDEGEAQPHEYMTLLWDSPSRVKLQVSTTPDAVGTMAQGHVVFKTSLPGAREDEADRQRRDIREDEREAATTATSASNAATSVRGMRPQEVVASIRNAWLRLGTRAEANPVGAAGSNTDQSFATRLRDLRRQKRTSRMRLLNRSPKLWLRVQRPHLRARYDNEKDALRRIVGSMDSDDSAVARIAGIAESTTRIDQELDMDRERRGLELADEFYNEAFYDSLETSVRKRNDDLLQNSQQEQRRPMFSVLSGRTTSAGSNRGASPLPGAAVEESPGERTWLPGVSAVRFVDRLSNFALLTEYAEGVTLQKWMLSSQWDHLACTVTKNLNDLFRLWLHHALHDPSHTFFHGDPHAGNIMVHIGNGLSSSASSTTKPDERGSTRTSTTARGSSSSGSASSSLGPCVSSVVRGIAQSCSPPEQAEGSRGGGDHTGTASESTRAVVDHGTLMNELPYQPNVEPLDSEIKSVAIPKDVGHLTLVDFGITFMSEEKQPLLATFRKFAAAVYFGSTADLRCAFDDLPDEDPFILAFEAEWPRLAALPLEKRMRAVATELLIPELPRLPAPQGMHEFLLALNLFTDVFEMFGKQKASVLATCVPQNDQASLSSSAVSKLSSYVLRGMTRGVDEPGTRSLLKNPLLEVLQDIVTDYAHDATGNLISGVRKKLRI
ncbi:unnamed protein product [Amoebophrya sp. A25]|nr:unnamed protein product [Amoebophrya sp. A25]|eukprot:GSA25T00024662001.1